MPTSENATASERPWSHIRVVGVAVLASVCSCLALATGFWLGGQRSQPTEAVLAPPPIMAATAGHSDTMAVATGLISEDVEGVFFLDFITGQLQCLVYYPRQQAFGAHFVTNVNNHMPQGGKNRKYILTTGLAVPRQATSGAVPGASMVYVTDVTSGFFAAFAVPWDRSAEPAGRVQAFPLIYRGGGQIRNFQLPDPQVAKPAAIVDPNQKKNP